MSIFHCGLPIHLTLLLCDGLMSELRIYPVSYFLIMTLSIYNLISAVKLIFPDVGPQVGLLTRGNVVRAALTMKRAAEKAASGGT